MDSIKLNNISRQAPSGFVIKISQAPATNNAQSNRHNTMKYTMTPTSQPNKELLDCQGDDELVTTSCILSKKTITLGFKTNTVHSDGNLVHHGWFLSQAGKSLSSPQLQSVKGKKCNAGSRNAYLGLSIPRKTKSCEFFSKKSKSSSSCPTTSERANAAFSSVKYIRFPEDTCRGIGQFEASKYSSLVKTIPR